MDLDLTSSRQKLKHAIGHIDTLRDKIGYPHTREIPLGRQFESTERAVVYRIDRVIEIADDWPLVTGDAIHDLRCALDHLAWQLALRFFGGVEPTERRVIRNIQFPIVSDKDRWPTHPHREYMLDVDAKKLEQFQPFNLGPKSRTAGALHPTEGLALVSDTDKHRRIQLLSFIAGEGQFRAPVPGDFVDCVPVVNADGQTLMTLNDLSGAIRPDDEVARILVEPTGPHPDVELHARLTGYVAFRESWDVIDALDTFAKGVETILDVFGTPGRHDDAPSGTLCDNDADVPG